MPYNTKLLKTDQKLNPVPQYFNTATDDYEPILGAGGASRVLLYDALGNPLLAQDTQKNLLTAQGSSSLLNITAVTAVKASAGRVIRISVIVAGTTAGSVNDAATTGAAAAANQIAAIPNTVGVVYLDWPCLNGIVVTPGTGQTLAVSYV